MKLLSCCQNTWVVDTTSCYYYYMQCPAPAATGGLKGTVATKMTKIIGPLKGSLLIAESEKWWQPQRVEEGHSSLTEKSQMLSLLLLLAIVLRALREWARLYYYTAANITNSADKRHSIFDVRSLISFLIYLEGDFDHDSHIRSNSNKILVVLLTVSLPIFLRFFLSKSRKYY